MYRSKKDNLLKSAFKQYYKFLASLINDAYDGTLLSDDKFTLAVIGLIAVPVAVLIVLVYYLGRAFWSALH